MMVANSIYKASHKLHTTTYTALDIHDIQASEKLAWMNYAIATELDKKSEAVQLATPLTVIGEEARDVFSTFTDWAEEGDVAKIEPVLMKFSQSTVCHARTCRLSGIVLTAVHKSLGKHTTNSIQH